MKALALLLIASGCYTPDVGDALVQFGDAGPTDDAQTVIGLCDNADTNPGAIVSFANHIRPLQNRATNMGGCQPCHLGRITSGFDQSTYQSLRRGGTNSGTRIVIPGEPCNSILFQKLGRTPPFGSRMPYPGTPYWNAEERALVHDWIAEGALNN